MRTAEFVSHVAVNCYGLCIELRLSTLNSVTLNNILVVLFLIVSNKICRGGDNDSW